MITAKKEQHCVEANFHIAFYVYFANVYILDLLFCIHNRDPGLTDDGKNRPDINKMRLLKLRRKKS